MGVSGSGKTTIGRLLAARLCWSFFDGDDYHSEANVARMATGHPLTDADRQPWLGQLRDLIQERLALGESSVVACSALKRSYRATLKAGDDRVRFLHLEGDFDLILGRMRSRAGHFMKAGMLRSQFETLEPPAQAIVIAVDAPLRPLSRLLCGSSWSDYHLNEKSFRGAENINDRDSEHFLITPFAT